MNLFPIDSKKFDEYKCSICYELMNEPVLINIIDEKCGHLFCNNCVTRSIRDNYKCPICKRACTPSMLVPDLRTERLIAELLFKCPHADCKWQGEYGNKGSNLTKHVDTCTFRPVCETCRELMASKHDDICQKKIIPCKYKNKGCSEEKTREEIESHVKICPFRPMTCQYAHLGLDECKLVQLYRDWAKHQIDCAQLHLSKLEERLYKEKRERFKLNEKLIQAKLEIVRNKRRLDKSDIEMELSLKLGDKKEIRHGNVKFTFEYRYKNEDPFLFIRTKCYSLINPVVTVYEWSGLHYHRVDLVRMSKTEYQSQIDPIMSSSWVELWVKLDSVQPPKCPKEWQLEGDTINANSSDSDSDDNIRYIDNSDSDSE